MKIIIGRWAGSIEFIVAVNEDEAEARLEELKLASLNTDEPLDDIRIFDTVSFEEALAHIKEV